MYDRWSAEHFPTVSESNIKGYKAAFLLCAPLVNKRFVDITLDDLQYIADNSGKIHLRLKIQGFSRHVIQICCNS